MKTVFTARAAALSRFFEYSEIFSRAKISPPSLGRSPRWVTFTAGLLALTAGLAATRSAAETSSTAIEPSTRIELLNTADLPSWTFFFHPTAAAEGKLWTAHDGVISFSSGYTGYLRTEKSYRNFLLHVEWRWPTHAGNSGVFIGQSGRDLLWPLSVQVNLKAGAAGELLAQDTLKFADGSKKIPAAHPAEKAFGEWNTLDIICQNDVVEVTVNGVKQARADHISTEGQIALQLENAAVDFRNVYLEPVGNIDVANKEQSSKK